MFLNLLALPARQVLNGVYMDLMNGCTKEDREDIINWCTCTYAEAKAFTAMQDKAALDERLELARMIGKVG